MRIMLFFIEMTNAALLKHEKRMVAEGKYQV